MRHSPFWSAASIQYRLHSRPVFTFLEQDRSKCLWPGALHTVSCVCFASNDRKWHRPHLQGQCKTGVNGLMKITTRPLVTRSAASQRLRLAATKRHPHSGGSAQRNAACSCVSVWRSILTAWAVYCSNGFLGLKPGNTTTTGSMLLLLVQEPGAGRSAVFSSEVQINVLATGISVGAQLLS
jgi:hypothetical protein